MLLRTKPVANPTVAVVTAAMLLGKIVSPIRAAVAAPANATRNFAARKVLHARAVPHVGIVNGTTQAELAVPYWQSMKSILLIATLLEFAMATVAQVPHVRSSMTRTVRTMRNV